MADIQLVWSCVFILTIVSMSYSDESCGDVKITSRVSKTFNMSVNDWLNMTFTLNTDKCSSPANVITVEKKEQDRPTIICRIHHNKTLCYTTGHEALYSCRCVSPKGPVEFWEKLVTPGDVEYKWRWKDESGKQGEKNITFHITTGDKKNTQRLQTTEFILGGTGGLLVIVVAVVVISTRCRKSSPSGGDVRITSPVSNTANVSVNDWLNMTFKFNTEKCTGPSYVITVEKKEQDRPMIICRIHHNKTSCYRTGHGALYSCHCVSPKGPVEFWEKLVTPGDVEYKWRWKNESGKQGEKNITFHVTTGDKKNTQRFQTMKFILGGTGGLLLIVIAVVFISARCHKSSPSATTESRKGQNTPVGSVQVTRPNPQTQAPVAGGNYRQETRCNQPFIVEDEYARVVRDPRRKAPAPRKVEQQEAMDMFINDLYDEKAL